MKRLLLSILLTICFTTSFSQKVVVKKQPLSFLPIDSVMVLQMMEDDKLKGALSLNYNLQPKMYEIKKISRKRFEVQNKMWQQRASDSLNLAGGTGDETNGKQQVLSALQTVDQAAPLFLQTADARYMEAIEKALSNGIRAGISGYLDTETTAKAGAAMFSAIAFYYATDQDGIYVNLFGNTNAVVTTPRFSYIVDQITSMPWLSRTTVRITYKSGNRNIKLHLRIPQWNTSADWANRYSFTPDELPTLYVNGKETPYKNIGGYAVVQRTWNSGDELYWDFNLRPHWIYRKASSKAALQRGPILFSPAEAMPDYLQLTKENLTENFDREFVRLYGKAQTKSGTTTQNILFLPYAESFTWDGKTNIWVKP